MDKILHMNFFEVQRPLIFTIYVTGIESFTQRKYILQAVIQTK